MASLLDSSFTKKKHEKESPEGFRLFKLERLRKNPTEGHKVYYPAALPNSHPIQI